MADFSSDTLITYVVKAVLIIVFLLLSVIFAIWFERKVVGRLQVRPGPNWHGPFGLLQPVADAGKLLIKEDITVKAADKIVYVLAPMISVFCSLLVFAVIPMGGEVTIPFTDITTPLQLTDFPVATLYILACASVGVYGIVLGGWSSGSTYPLLGSVRSTAQVISYELSMGLSLVSVFIMAGTMSTSEIVNTQDKLWWFLPLFPAFVIYVISMMGEVNRLPFDLPEAEGELVSGYMTEYSSMKFAWFFLAEYINMINVSAVATTLFFGGWHAPFGLGNLWGGALEAGWMGFVWFLIKVWSFMFFFVWVRGTVVRFRYDQFMQLGWKILIPAALGWVFILAIFQALQTFLEIDAQPFLIGASIIAALVLVVTLVLDGKAVAKEKAEQAAATNARHAAPELFDPFAAGYPVPPKPGEKLPPSPRAARRAAQEAASAQVAVEAGGVAVDVAEPAETDANTDTPKEGSDD